MMILSIIMSFKILHGLAPIALRTPNSRVRSRTEINMILLTPTIPLSRVKMPTIHKDVRIIDTPWFICIFDVKRFHIQTASSSSGAASWLRFTLALYCFSKASFSSSVFKPLKVKTIWSALSQRPYMMRKVLNGIYADSDIDVSSSLLIPTIRKEKLPTFTSLPTSVR